MAWTPHDSWLAAREVRPVWHVRYPRSHQAERALSQLPSGYGREIRRPRNVRGRTPRLDLRTQSVQCRHAEALEPARGIRMAGSSRVGSRRGCTTAERVRTVGPARERFLAGIRGTRLLRVPSQ